MLNDKYLVPKWRTPDKRAIRDGIGKSLVEMGSIHEDIVVVSADLAESVRTAKFREDYPERFFEVGVAEQNMIGVAAGLASTGLSPFAVTYACFSPGRSWEQIRVSVSMSNANVKIVGSHGGVATGVNGPSHQATEDIALMRVLPKMCVLVPCDAIQAEEAVRAAYNHHGPVYIRATRPNTAEFTKPGNFEIGKAYVYREGKDITICACGLQVYESLAIAEELAKEKIDCEVINVSSIKPLDEETILNSARKTGKIITIEDHQTIGGMGSAIAELMSQKYPLLVKRVGIDDRFGISAEPDKAYQEVGLDHETLKKAVVDWFHE